MSESTNWFGRRDPDARGYYGAFGGRFVPETLVAPIEALESEYLRARKDPSFEAELTRLLTHYVGRPTPLWEAERLSAAAGGARIFLKREDLTHTGAHKINNALGQALLAKRMGKTRVVAETGAGQHGVASATVCALLGLECVVYMGTEDMRRQALNVFRMRLLGATVEGVDSGARTLKDAINEAMRDWVARPSDTHYLLGSALGPHPYPLMVREFQSVIGREARQQIVEQTGGLPHAVIACVGGGSNAIGIFDAFIDDPGVRLIGVEAGGEAIRPGRHAARFAGGAAGVLQGTRTFVLQDADGNIELTHSVSAGLDYAAVGPEHAWLQETGRAEYAYATDSEALKAFEELSRLEGILPALESAHAIAHVLAVAKQFPKDAVIVVNLSGRGDKDVNSVQEILEGDRACEETRDSRRDRAEDSRRSQIVSRIEERFTQLRGAGKTGLVTYVTAGDPDLTRSAEIIKRLDRAGADVLEVGIPFSDPLADGPVIQRATERALAAGANIRNVLGMLKTIRPGISAPIVIFSYANPILRMGLEAFVTEARAAGVDGVLTLDMPPEEGETFRTAFTGAGIDTIFLLSPTTTVERIRRASELGSGFLYGISRLGVTGCARHDGRLGARARDARQAGNASAAGARIRHLAARARARDRAVGGRRGGRQRPREGDRRTRRDAGVTG